MRALVHFLIGLSFTLSPASASQNHKQPIILPSQACGLYFLVPVSFPSKKNDGPTTLIMLLDTGAYDTYIDPDAFKKISGKKVKVNSPNRTGISYIGEMRIKRRYVYAAELDAISLILGTQIDGILGFSTFKDWKLTLDYPDQSISIVKETIAAPNGKTIFSSKGLDDRPWINVKVGTKKLKLLIDSAAGDALSVSTLKGIDVSSEPIAASYAQGIDKSYVNYTTRAASDLTFGKHRVEKPIISVIPNEKIFTAQLMQHYQISFDQKNKRIELISKTDSPIQSVSQSRRGALIAPIDGKLKVLDVSPESPAAKAGVKTGDIVSAINGLKPERRGCDLQSIPEDSILTFRRDNTEYQRKINPETLIK